MADNPDQVGKVIFENGRSDFIEKLPDPTKHFIVRDGDMVEIKPDYFRQMLDSTKPEFDIRQTMWMGPICPTCDTRYLGYHTCTPVQLRSKADQLRKQADQLEAKASKEEPKVKENP